MANPYQPGKPLPFDFLNDSQSELQNNYNEWNRQFGLDHFPFTDADGGKHKYITYVRQDDIPTTDTDEVVAFSQYDNDDEEVERVNIFVRYQNLGPQMPYTPYMQAYVVLNSDGSISELTTSINFDEDESGWDRGAAKIAFIFPNNDSQYYVEGCFGNTRPGVTGPIAFNHKSQNSFEVSIQGSLRANDRLYLRVY